MTTNQTHTHIARQYARGILSYSEAALSLMRNGLTAEQAVELIGRP